MAIKGLIDEEKISLPRLFKYSLGFRDWNNKGVPVSVDYFRPQWCRLETDSEKLTEREKVKFQLQKEKFEEQLVSIYGTNKPKTLHIMFPFDKMEDNFQYFLRLYDGKKNLLCKGDGYVDKSPEEITPEVLATENPEIHHGAILDGEEPQFPDGKCRGMFCPRYKKKECSVVANLVFIDININPIGLIQLDTGSKNNIQGIYSTVKFLKKELKLETIKAFPLELMVVYEQVSFVSNGKKFKSNAPFIKIAPATSISKAQEGKAIDLLDKKAIEMDFSVDEYDEEISLIQNKKSPLELTSETFDAQETHEFSEEAKQFAIQESQKSEEIDKLFKELNYSTGVINNIKKRFRNADEIIIYLTEQIENKKVAEAKKSQGDLFNA